VRSPFQFHFYLLANVLLCLPGMLPPNHGRQRKGITCRQIPIQWSLLEIPIQ
jgi:hypothetical protein